MRGRLFLLCAAASCLTVLPAAAQRPANFRRAQAAANGANEDTAGVPAVEKVSTTHHNITIGGKQIAYTADAGTMVLRDDDGKPNASVFYISYSRDDAQKTNRPVTFFFNGGPGSASIWLSMGIMSPKYPEMGPAGAQPAPPYNLVDNPNSPLDVTDLVQVDAMMTGYSRPAPGINASEFTGARNDITMFAKFIRNYLDKYDRWASPKYLFGESYGTFRSAGLSSELQDNGIELNGIMLLGTVLDFKGIRQSATNDLAFATFVPTYAATAWFHKKLPADLQKMSLEDVVQQARDYAFGDYLTALTKGNSLTAAERTEVAKQLARLTGVSETYAMNTNLRIDAGTYRTELLRDRRLTLGRYDSRMTGLNGNAASTRQDYDPSDVAPTGAFMSAFMRFLHNDLKYESNLEYYMGGHTGRWDYSNFSGYPTEIESLREAMAKDPYLHVLVGAGYYDMATPFANAEYEFDHLGFDQTYRDRVKFNYYESGHMAYLNQPSAKQLKANIADFIASTSRNMAVTP
jgi:carboxypeptidase C (cathepsin A)